MNLWICLLVLLPVALATPTHPGQYFDPLKEGKKEWRLAFRGTANIGQSVYKAYTEGTNKKVEPACKGMNWPAPCKSHYRNDDALDNWWNVKDVLFGIVKDGAIVKSLMFNGKGTNNVDWFSKKNVKKTDNCWHDFKGLYIFGIPGHEVLERRFFIQHKYGGCPNDEGWFVAIDGDKRPCPWEKDAEDFPIFKYAPGLTRVNWQKGAVAKADAIVVFLRYNEFPGQVQEYHDLFKSGKKEWRLAFRGSAGVGTSLFDAYKTGAGIPAKVGAGCMSVDWKAPCNSHYRNKDVFDNWKGVKKVLFGIVADGALVKTMTFRAAGTNYMNWYRFEYLLDSCWHDLPSKVARNYFSIVASAHLYRRFFINHKYGGCPNDVGWVVAVDTQSKSPCAWEKSPKKPKLLYSAGMYRANWNRLDGPVKEAQAFVVFVQ